MLEAIQDIFGGHNVIHRKLDTKIDLVDLGRAGVPKNAIMNLANYLSVPFSRISTILPVTDRTLQRYKPTQTVSSIVSEHAIQIAELIARGEEVLEDKENFLGWLNEPSVALGGRTPRSFLNSSVGIELVKDELGRIESGVYV